jgi:hypothetical protein
MTAGQGDVEVAAVSPARKAGVERNGLRGELVAERLEEPPQHGLATAARHHGHAGFQRDRQLGEGGPLLAATTHGGPEHLREGHGEKRRCHVRSVVDVLGERELVARRAPPVADEADRIDVDE